MSAKASPPLERRLEMPSLHVTQRPFVDQSQDQRRRRFLALALSVAGHLMAFAAILWLYNLTPPTQVTSSRAPILVSVVTLPTPSGPPGPAGPPGPPGTTQAQAVSPPNVEPPPLPHMSVPAAVSPSAIKPLPLLAAVSASTSDTSDVLNDSQLAGASSVGDAGAGGGGGGGGSCDVARAVQQALRRDPLVRAAVQDAHRWGKAIMLWNGDWVRSGEQEGKGLSAVREAIVWEVAFAPKACLNENIHGLVLLSLQDGNTRFAIGSGEWRWSDLLGTGRVWPDH